MYYFKVGTVGPANWNWVIRIPRYFELNTISLGFSLQSFSIGYLEYKLFRTILCFPWDFERAVFNWALKGSKRY